MVGVRGFEPPAPAFRTQYSNQAELHSVARPYSQAGPVPQDALGTIKSHQMSHAKTHVFQQVLAKSVSFLVSIPACARFALVGRRGFAKLALGLAATGLVATGLPAPAQARSSNPFSKKNLPLVMIDPGHGGNDPGAIAADGLL